jgi:serine/threonine-protein kinase
MRQESEAGTTLLGGRYRLDGHIAFGGMGEVRAATDTLLGREVAVKVLRADLAADERFRERFRAEARHASVLAHPHVVQVYDYGEQVDGEHVVAFLVMERVDGPPLAAVLAAGPIGLERAVDVAVQTADGLAAAHARGIVHRDVKPGNILLGATGVKLADFGIARAMDTVPITEVGQTVGTAAYMAPEQARGLPATPATDVYALAVVTYEMLAGRLPFIASSPAALALAQVRDVPPPLPDAVPAAVREVVERALAKDPAERPADGAAFGRELARAVERSHAPVGTQEATAAMPAVATATAMMPAPAATMARTLHDERRRRRVIVAASAATVLGLAALWSVADGTTLDRSTPDAAAADSTVVTETTTAPVTTLAQIDATTLVGLAEADARARLDALGIDAVSQSVTAEAPAGIVVAVDPAAVVQAGGQVILSVSSGPPPSVTPAPGDGTTKGKGQPKGKGKEKPKGKEKDD